MAPETQWSAWASEIFAIAFVVSFLTPVLAGCAGPQTRPFYSEGFVRFSIEAPEQAEVTLVVMERAPLHPVMKEYATDRGPDGHRVAAVKLSPGEYRYFFRVDDEIVVDPQAPRHERDDFGGVNGVLLVKSIAGGSMQIQ